MSGNLCRCGAYANIVAGDRRGRPPVIPFRYEQPQDVARRRRAARRDARRGAYLGGGTNLVDLMKLGVDAPELLVDVTRVPSDRDRGAARRRPAHRRGRAQQRPRNARGRAPALPARRRGRCWPAPRRSCATSPRPAATCSSARAASTSRTSRSPATSASRAAAARRARATTATWRSSGTPRPAWPRTPRTSRSRWPRWTRWSACRGRRASAPSRSPTCTASPATSRSATRCSSTAS